MTITITVNGESADLPDGSTLRDLVSQRIGVEVGEDGRARDGSPLGVAVALDESVVPRSRWHTTPVPTASRCEILTAVQGG